ncbi:MAG: class I SAM-dependent methyltransferase [Lentisphaerae bacterium]|nr:class I SAM-dependent methyltransferase [Lentisphaerota bacterium]
MGNIAPVQFMTREITSKRYDENVAREGLQFQKDNYYEPKDPQKQKRIEVVLQALAPAPGEMILDIGCGVGTFAFHAAKAGASTLGIDYSAASIRVAETLVGHYGLAGRARFVMGSALDLPFDNASFDKVVSADFIEHITDQEKYAFCREITRVLKPGGRIVIFTPNLRREKIGNGYWVIRHYLFGDRVPVTDLHYGLITRFGFGQIMRVNGWKYSLKYIDIGRPYLAVLPLLRDFLSLNLLWVVCPGRSGKGV